MGKRTQQAENETTTSTASAPDQNQPENQTTTTTGSAPDQNRPEVKAQSQPPKAATPALRITARPKEGFCRCGVRHSAEPTSHKAGTFTVDQLEILKAEPMLVVEEITDAKK